mgnify:CR=1 FL=1
MIRKDCIFCKIVRGELPSYKIYEDENHLAILDIYPQTKGQTLIITKKHYPSDPFKLPDKVLSNLILTSKKVAKMIEKSLKPKRIFLVIEGMEIDHIHVKLYPKYKIERSIENKNFVYDEVYHGYLTTLHGPKAKDEELKKIVEKIKKRK